jgi:hypothetical protein
VGRILSLRVLSSPMTHLVCKCSGCDIRDQLIVLLREKFEMGSSIVSFSLEELASPPCTEPRTHSPKTEGLGNERDLKKVR